MFNQELVSELLDILENKVTFPGTFFNYDSKYECCGCGAEAWDDTSIVHNEDCSYFTVVKQNDRIEKLITLIKESKDV